MMVSLSVTCQRQLNNKLAPSCRSTQSFPST